MKWNGPFRFGPTGIFRTSFEGGPLWPVWSFRWVELSICQNCRVRVVPHFPSGIVERAKRERAWKTREKRRRACRLLSRESVAVSFDFLYLLLTESNNCACNSTLHVDEKKCVYQATIVLQYNSPLYFCFLSFFLSYFMEDNLLHAISKLHHVYWVQCCF